MQSSSNVFIVIIFTFSIVSLFSDRKRYEARGSFHLLASSNVKSFRLQIDQSRQMFTIYIFYMYLKLSHSSPCHFKSLKFNNLLYRKDKFRVTKHLESVFWISRIQWLYPHLLRPLHFIWWIKSQFQQFPKYWVTIAFAPLTLRLFVPGYWLKDLEGSLDFCQQKWAASWKGSNWRSWKLS